MAMFLAIGEAPHLAIGLWILLAICFLGAFCVGLYGMKDVIADEWRAHQAGRPAATRAEVPKQPAHARAA